MNLYAALRSAFPADLARCAIETDAGLCYSWADLEQGSAMLANLIAHCDIPEGSRIAVQVEKSVECAMLYLAVLRSGHVFLPLNIAYQRAEMEYFVGNAEPAIVVCSSDNFAWVSKTAFEAGSKHVFTLNANRTGTLLDRAAHFGSQFQTVPCGSESLAAIVYTSGTTGRSKGAMLSHANLLSNAQVLKEYWGWRSEEQGGDVLIHALPIFHVHGLFVAIHGAMLNGSKMLWMGRFDPQKTIEWMRDPQRKASVFMGVPTLYTRLLAQPQLTREVTAGMRLFVSGSAPLLKETHAEWEARTHHKIVERYGMSETGMLTSNPCHADSRYGNQCERRAGTVGFALPQVQLRICDAQDREVPVGEIGGIEVKGPNVFSGYWRMPEKNREEFTADGFFRTGDMGCMDRQGYVHIVGRSKDLIISGGYNVYPAEVEGYINDIAGVAESALIGVPHPDFGEVGVAVVVPQVGAAVEANHITAVLRERLANFKIPKLCVLATDLPRNAMGKVQKNLLREQYRSVFTANTNPPAAAG